LSAPGPTRQRWGLVATAAGLGAALVGALVTGSQIGGVNRTVEALSALSGSRLGQIAEALPFGYAFGAGMVAAANPCGFALLPAYLALYLRPGTQAAAAGTGDRLRRVLAVSGAMTAGFLIIFGGAGLALGAASSAIGRYLPWLGLAVGVLLVVVGGRMLGGALVYATWGDRVADLFGASAQERGPRGYFAYGLAYAAASLSCALPIFLGVVASALAAGGVGAASLQFALYALGMGFVITALTAGTAFIKEGVVARARPLVRYGEPVSAMLLLLAGSYIVYYWLTLGGILGALEAGFH
jgi:cytochrome c biogenesis protein CcdA